jgi:hypothetical protein
MAGRLNYQWYAGEAGGQWKGRSMWVFDGEEWTEEGTSSSSAKPENSPIRIDELMPELQIIEIVPVPQTNYVPPFPLP